VTDWRPISEWIVVEDCSCAGYFVWAPMLERVRALPMRERHDLTWRVRDFRKFGLEAWVATTTGVVTGALVIRTLRHARVGCHGMVALCETRGGNAIRFEPGADVMTRRGGITP
jgi:hypothetical protein